MDQIVQEELRRSQQRFSREERRSIDRQSMDTIFDKEYRVRQLSLIENELRSHFKYGMTDQGIGKIKPLLASRAFETSNLRQLACEMKIE
jgi:hypothetical protein